jgi:hypothetical protein
MTLLKTLLTNRRVFICAWGNLENSPGANNLMSALRAKQPSGSEGWEQDGARDDAPAKFAGPFCHFEQAGTKLDSIIFHL